MERKGQEGQGLLFLDDIIKTYQGLDPSKTNLDAVFQIIRGKLLLHIDQLQQPLHRNVVGQLNSITQLLSITCPRNYVSTKNYQKLEFLLSLLISLSQTTLRFKNELQFPQCNNEGVHVLLHIILNGIDEISYQLTDFRQNISIIECKAITAKAIIPLEVHQNEVLFEMLGYKLSIKKSLNPTGFDRWLSERIIEIISCANQLVYEKYFLKEIKVLHKFFSILNESQKEFVYFQFYQLLQKPDLNVNLFMGIIPLLNEKDLRFLIPLKCAQWIDKITEALKAGNFDVIQNYLASLSNAKYYALLRHELESILKAQDILEILRPIHLDQYPKEGLIHLVKIDFNARIKALRSQLPSLPIVNKTLEGIEKSKEYGIAIRKFHLLEILNQNSSNEMLIAQLQMISALDNGNMQALEAMLEIYHVQPWDKLEAGDSLLVYASQLTVLQQKRGQLAVSCQFDLEAQVAAEKMFYDFLEITKKRWSRAHSQRPWQLVIEMVNDISGASNRTYISFEGKIFIGEWDNTEEIYNKILKIFIPINEQKLWIKYCPDVINFSPQKHTRMRKIYQGSQETYGMWFHLSYLAAMEFDSFEFKTFMKSLGEYRKIIFSCLCNLPISKDWVLSYSIKEKIKNKIIDSDMIEFGKPVYYFNVFSIVNPYYTQKIIEIVGQFEKAHSEELTLLNQAKLFLDEGKEIIVYTGKLKNNSYVITIPSIVNHEKVYPTLILVNWPNRPFFFPGQTPIKLSKSQNRIMIVHVSGKQKKPLVNELENLFTQLFQPQEDLSIFEGLLSQFLYLFFQTMYFSRGNASIGMILLNFFLARKHRLPPDAPFYRRLDLEAMVCTEEEFRKVFLRWLHEGVFFD